MELKELQPIVMSLVFIGIILGIGMLIFSNFGDAVKTSTTLSDNETIAIASGAGTTTNDEVTALTFFGNASNNTVNTPDWTFGQDINFTEAGAITANGYFQDGNYDIRYTYDADSETTDLMDSMETAIAPIGSTWIGLIVTIVVLAIILGLVIKSFAMQR